MRYDEGNQPPFVLASSSPRRAELIARMGIRFIVDAADVDERDVDGPPEAQVCTLAKRKAEAVAIRHPNAWILAADTLVYCDRVLGKPSSEGEAFEMLRHLSGRWHAVYSGMCLMNGQCQRVCHVMTRVHFQALSDADIRAYLATHESMDKAGAYGIQGRAGMFIDRIDGCYTNVMGLPIPQLRSMMGAFGWEV